MADPLPGLLNLTPLNPEFRDDPHRLLTRLREECPVRRDELAGTFMVSRFKDARALLNDRTLWRGPDKAEPSAGFARLLETFEEDPDTHEKRATTILLMDDPDHARVRGPFAQALYARAAKCRPQVEEIVDETLAALQGRAGFDVLGDFAIPIPIDVIGALLGVDRARRAEFRDWSEGAIQTLNPLRTPEQTAHMGRATAALDGHFDSLMTARRNAPADDLITDMVRLQADGAPLSDREIRRNLIGLLVAGNLTTSDLIGNGVHLLLTHAGELAKFKADLSLAGAMVEEILRYAPPVEITGRVASRDMEIGSCPVKQTQAMVALLRAANRDPEQYENPDSFDITRKPGPHMAFGGGAHICIGAPLARLEAQIAFIKLFARFPNVRLARPEETPPKRMLPFFNGFERLDVLI